MGGIFGGDSSVKWKVIADAPQDLENRPIPETGKPARHRQGGREATPASSYFLVSIEVPRTTEDRNDLARGLEAASKALTNMPPGNGRAWFRVRIEDTQNGIANEDQIRVDWPGSTAASGGGVGAGETIPGTPFPTPD